MNQNESNPINELKQNVQKLIKLLDVNTTDMWYPDLEDTAPCIVLENMDEESVTESFCLEDGDNKYSLTGGQIADLMTKIEKQLLDI